MAQLALDVLDVDHRDENFILEGLIQQKSTDLDTIRSALCNFLATRTQHPTSSISVEQSIAMLASKPCQDATAAIVVLRCLAVQGIIPEPTPSNQIARFIVEICEDAVPDILSFLKVEKREQNFKKFAALTNCHNRITQILNPLCSPYGDLEALMSSRSRILGCLNHGIVCLYLSPYKIAEIRTTIESLLGRIKKVVECETTFLQDVDECNRIILSAREEIKLNNSFLSNDFLNKFLDTCDEALLQFTETQIGRFTSNIEWGGSVNNHRLQKKYPLHEPEREIQITIPLRNSGSGMAIDVRVTTTPVTDHIVLSGETVMIGNVPPGDFSITLDAMIVTRSSAFKGILNLEWGEIGNPSRKSEVLEFEVLGQSDAIDWDTLRFAAPYGTSVAKGEQFVGRADRINLLAARLLRNPMEPFYITGQKRVGKTSLALAAAEFAKKQNRDGNLLYHYTLWGDVAHPDPHISIQHLGEEIETFIINSLPTSIAIEKGNYHGSLASLIKLSRFAFNAAPDHRFIIILDEFDEIHQELFLQGNLAETFFSNLRALSRCANICIILIGGENMPFIMDRQGQKLNNFSRFNLSYYSRDSEWIDFQLLVKTPTNDDLDWDDDAISEIFNITNGNPYFAKIVCEGVYRSAVSGRDAHITASEVRRATEAAISALDANSFLHLWQDGVPKAVNEREPDILRRMRVLVAMARCLRQKIPPSANCIAEHKTSPSLSQPEIVAVLNDFVKRAVLTERDGRYGFGLPIFQMWLVDVGSNQLIADKLNEDLASEILALENDALVRSEEVVALSRQWPTYRGKHIGTDDIKAWYQQVDGIRDQRILFDLLKRVRFFSESLVRERLRSAHDLLRPTLPTFVKKKRGARRTDTLLVYVDGEGKSGPNYASLYAEENGIAASCIMSSGDFGKKIKGYIEQNQIPKAIVIIDDIAATGKSLAKNVETFINDHHNLLADMIVRIVTLVSTEEAQEKILKSIQKIDHKNIDFRSCEILTIDAFAFPSDSSFWSSRQNMDRAKALCKDLGSKIYKKYPLGYGNMGLLVVFPTTVPNNCLPIIHSYSRTDSAGCWEPLFPRIVN